MPLKKTYTFENLLHLFYEDKINLNYFRLNITKEEKNVFTQTIKKDPNYFLAGRNLTKKQIQLLEKELFIIKCNNEDCYSYHSKFDTCNECVNKFFTNKKINKKDLECIVCMNTIHKYTSLSILNCNHYFHKKCISTWLKKKKNCPCCRTKFVKYNYNLPPNLCLPSNLSK